MLSLEKAIKHCEEVAEEQYDLYTICLPEYHCDGLSNCSALTNGKDKGCLKCATEYRQLAEWLRELKGYSDDKDN